MHRSRILLLKASVMTFTGAVGSIVCGFMEPKVVWLALMIAPAFSFIFGMSFFAVLLPNSWFRHRDRIMSRRQKTP